MVSSTAIPILMAAMVMVIMSKGMFIHPITPKTAPAEKRLGKSAIKATFIERKSKRNITSNASATKPKVLIWDAKRLCSILLYNTMVPDSFTLSVSIFNW